MEKKKQNYKAYIIFFIVSAISMIASKAGQYIVSGLLLLILAGGMTCYYFRISQSLVDFRVLLSIFWVGGESIASFQLSNLQSEWTITTWCCFTIFYLMFLAGYDYLGKWLRIEIPKNKKNQRKKVPLKRNLIKYRLLNCISMTALISSITFFLEMLMLGYVPILSKEVHAYSEFHITGLHYFTVSCMMVHALTVIYLMMDKKKIEKREAMILAVANSMAFLIAISCISKFQILLTVALPAIIYLRMKKNVNHRKILLLGGIGAGMLALLFGFMIIRRNYAPGYLNDIFEMKNQNLPMTIQYPYMYIANNFANFNCLTEQLPAHTMGLKQLFPFFALTGLKFVFPQLVNFPMYITKTELNTLTIIYDVYYDFGVVGVAAFGILLGLVCRYLTQKIKTAKNPIFYLFYGQIAIYVMLSFFSAWFSVTTTWFWLLITEIMYVYVKYEGKTPKKSKRVFRNLIQKSD